MDDVLALKRDAFLNAALAYIRTANHYGTDSSQAQDAYRVMGERAKDYREECDSHE